MNWGRFKQAFEVYVKCKEADIEISMACRIALLDFLCIYNSQDMNEKLPLNELWYARSDKKEAEERRTVVNTWK
jgi:hypothetical protein